MGINIKAERVSEDQRTGDFTLTYAFYHSDEPDKILQRSTVTGGDKDVIEASLTAAYKKYVEFHYRQERLLKIASGVIEDTKYAADRIVEELPIGQIFLNGKPIEDVIGLREDIQSWQYSLSGYSLQEMLGTSENIDTGLVAVAGIDIGD